MHLRSWPAAASLYRKNAGKPHLGCFRVYTTINNSMGLVGMGFTGERWGWIGS